MAAQTCSASAQRVRKRQPLGGSIGLGGSPQQEVQANDLAGRLGQLCVGTFTEAAMHTPVAITEQALAVARERQADCTVALGGGFAVW
jgi:alcohol dehydrogenase class IV